MVGFDVEKSGCPKGAVGFPVNSSQNDFDVRFLLKAHVFRSIFRWGCLHFFDGGLMSFPIISKLSCLSSFRTAEGRLPLGPRGGRSCHLVAMFERSELVNPPKVGVRPILMRPDGTSLVLGPFAVTKGPRPPGPKPGSSHIIPRISILDLNYKEHTKGLAIMAGLPLPGLTSGWWQQ